MSGTESLNESRRSEQYAPTNPCHLVASCGARPEDSRPTEASRSDGRTASKARRIAGVTGHLSIGSQS